MKRILVVTASLLFATPVLAQQPPLPPISLPQDLLQRISAYLQEGGSHNEGVSLNHSLIDAISIQQSTAQIKAQTDKIAALEKQVADAKTPDAPK